MKSTINVIENSKKIMFSTLIISMISEEIELSDVAIEVLRNNFLSMSVEKLSEIYNNYSENGFANYMINDFRLQY